MSYKWKKYVFNLIITEWPLYFSFPQYLFMFHLSSVCYLISSYPVELCLYLISNSLIRIVTDPVVTPHRCAVTSCGMLITKKLKHLFLTAGQAKRHARTLTLVFVRWLACLFKYETQISRWGQERDATWCIYLDLLFVSLWLQHSKTTGEDYAAWQLLTLRQVVKSLGEVWPASGTIRSQRDTLISH